MRLFYIPDGHRRYAEAAGCSLVKAYEIGYDVLLHEVIVPLFDEGVEYVDIFLLSSLNLRRRETSELDALIEHGTPMLHRLIDECRPLASIRTVGTFLPKNIEIPNPSTDRELTLVVGSVVDDDIGCQEADLFVRSGGEIRLSGAPRTIVGNYTQFYGLPQLHPELTFADVKQCLDSYRQRYMRRTDAVNVM